MLLEIVFARTDFFFLFDENLDETLNALLFFLLAFQNISLFGFSFFHIFSLQTTEKWYKDQILVKFLSISTEVCWALYHGHNSRKYDAVRGRFRHRDSEWKGKEREESEKVSVYNLQRTEKTDRHIKSAMILCVYVSDHTNKHLPPSKQITNNNNKKGQNKKLSKEELGRKKKWQLVTCENDENGHANGMKERK